MRISLHFENSMDGYLGKYLKYDILDITSISLKVDDKVLSNPLLHTELIDTYENSLITKYFEKIFEFYGNDLQYYYNLENEGFNLDQWFRTTGPDSRIYLIDLLKEIFNKNNVPIENLILHTGNINQVNKRKYNYNVISSVAPWYNNVFKLKDASILERKIDKKFLFLNRIPKEHRVILYNNLKNMDILSNAIYSFNAEGDPKYDDCVSLEDNGYVSQNQAMVLNEEFFEKVFCNIITESEFYTNEKGSSIYKSVFFTEKTGKSLNMGVPFILVTGSGSLAKLKELGFKTFDKWWDESYDECEDDYERLMKIVVLVRKINKTPLDKLQEIYEDMKPTLLHNMQLYDKFTDKKFNRQFFFPKPYSDYDCFW